MLRSTFPILLLGIIIIATSGCLFEELKANERALEAQQIEIDRQAHELATLRQQSSYEGAPAPTGSCDRDIMRKATRRGGERFAAGDYKHALGYYDDALKACPRNAEAELNLARTYEAMEQRAPARLHYQKAVEAAGGDDLTAARQAQEALARIGSSN
jgi:tetratricopeptide (TPR) repeat protein